MAASGSSNADIARELGVHRNTVARILNAPRRRAQPTREAGEFNVAGLAEMLEPPRRGSEVFAWDLPQIRSARDDQMRGRFERPAQMAAAMRTDPAMFQAHSLRTAPARSLGVDLLPAARGPSATAKMIAGEAEALYGSTGVGVQDGCIASACSDLANHGIAILYNDPRPRLDGTRVDFYVRHWPIEFVSWDDYECTLKTSIELMSPAGQRLRGKSFDVPITHGDGRWTVITKHATRPWTQEACILPGGLVWGLHASALRDWGKGSRSHGNAKVIGEMAEGMAIRGKDDALSKEAVAFLRLLRDVADLDSPVGIKPAGSKLDYLVNSSRAWEVWAQLAVAAERLAARIYLGTDGTMGALGGAPGVDISALFSVATTVIQTDLSAIERAFYEGVLEPWCAVNFGDSKLAPWRAFRMPDADDEADAKGYAERSVAFHADVASHKANGFEVDQALVDDLAKRYRVRAPKLSEAPAMAPPSPDVAPGAPEPPAARRRWVTDLSAFWAQHGRIEA